MRLLVLLCVFLYYLVGVIRAAPTTNTTNTTTSDIFKAPSFTTRTLWSIISSSVLTLFACVYSAIHPNIPNPKHSGYPHTLWRQLGMMIMALILPELIATWAMRQWFSAHQVTRQFEKSGYPNVRPESEEMSSVKAPGNRFLRCILLPFVHIFLLLAKGVLSVPVSLLRVLCAPVMWVARRIKSEQSESDLEDYTWTQTHSFFVLMGGFMLYVDGKPYLTLRPDYIVKLTREGCIDVSTLTAKQIHDRSKGNAISKGSVILQVAWFIIQLITRAIYHLETTQLEMGTLAFAVLNFLTYAVWWNKPLDVQCPHPVYWKLTESMPEDHIENELARFGILAPVFRPVLELIGIPDIPTSRKLQVPTFDGSINLEDSDKNILQLAALLMASTFGGIHFMALFYTSSPGRNQATLWSMSSFIIISVPFAYVQIYFMLPNRYLTPFFIVGFSLHALLYIVARACLLVLMFTTLRHLPPDAHIVVSWTSLVPHL
ncbi:uncharacterized protein F5147DRAFT_265548 [Suillus discolor]|uniref:Uncharacterized protein n=1 Tax=Suillus discolor TaxID=1912936 RepID=A0A9P7JS85_9AGAM|nr:uncharacterized protein F5147DRAFT_265548 [Suillus discolor]KAG2104357.1 hypothetical protein F5147DRAFT_265548 [Suillus discolor]